MCAVWGGRVVGEGDDGKQVGRRGNTMVMGIGGVTTLREAALVMMVLMLVMMVLMLVMMVLMLVMMVLMLVMMVLMLVMVALMLVMMVLVLVMMELLGDDGVVA